MGKKRKPLLLDEAIDSIIDLLEDLRYEQSKNTCENCQVSEDDNFDSNINDNDDEEEYK
jgi:hypothetical protein